MIIFAFVSCHLEEQSRDHFWLEECTRKKEKEILEGDTEYVKVQIKTQNKQQRKIVDKQQPYFLNTKHTAMNLEAIAE